MTINSAQTSPGGYRFWTVMAAATLLLVAAGVAGCSKKVARTPDPRPVRTVTVESRADGETVSFTGQIRAKDQVNLAFRLDGRMIERHAGVGDVIAAGQVVASLDSQMPRRPCARRRSWPRAMCARWRRRPIPRPAPSGSRSASTIPRKA
jgi:hypothetical protein